jgi:hypothetical protein
VESLKDLLKSSFSLAIALSLFALKQTENLFTADDSQKAIETVSNTTAEQLGGTLRNTFSALDNVQRGLVEVGFAFFPGRRSTHVFEDGASFDSRQATVPRTLGAQPLTGRRS